MTFQQQNPILYPTEGGDPSPMETAGYLRNLCALLFILCALLTVPAISGSLPALALLPAGAALLPCIFCSGCRSVFSRSVSSGKTQY